MQRGRDQNLRPVFIENDERNTPDQRVNWLPTRREELRPILRKYERDDSVFDEGYESPSITGEPKSPFKTVPVRGVEVSP